MIVGWLVGWLVYDEGKITLTKAKKSTSIRPCCPSWGRHTNDLILYLSELSHSLVAAVGFSFLFDLRYRGPTSLQPEVGSREMTRTMCIQPV